MAPLAGKRRHDPDWSPGRSLAVGMLTGVGLWLLIVAVGWVLDTLGGLGRG